MYAVVAVHAATFVTDMTDTCCVKVIFIHLYHVFDVSFTLSVAQCAFATVDPVKVNVVSTKDVVTAHARTVAVAIASYIVHDGFHVPSSSSILILMSADGARVFLSDSFTELKDTQFQNTGIEALVLAVTSHTFCTHVASANVVHTSGITLSHADHASHIIYFSIS